MTDARHAARVLVKTPGFTTVAILTIALGIGATTTIFTIVNALLIRPLPYKAPEQLVMVWQDWTARGGPADKWASPGNFLDWQNEPELFTGLAALAGWRPTLTGEGDAEAIPGEQVSRQYFSVLGISPLAGRGFEPDDDVPNARRVVMVSEGFWRRRFGGDPAMVGRTLLLGGEPHEIVGVVPAGTRPVVAPDAELWRPLRLDLATPARGAVFLRVVARLPDGVPHAQAQARATALAKRLETEHPRFNDKVGFTIEPLHARVVSSVRETLLALLGGVGFVLLIACVNVANLLMARGSARGRELAVRTAVGASRWRVLRHLMTESLLLATLGGLGGLLLAAWGVEALVRLAPAGTPRLNEVTFDATVFAVAALVTFGTGLLFGLAPAFQHSRVDVTHALKDGGRGTGTGGQGIRRTLVAAEVALAIVLLSGGLLLVQTFARLNASDLGFRTRDVLVGSFNPPQTSYETPEQFTALYDQVLERAAAIPGVRRAALASILPLAPGDNDMSFQIEGRPETTSVADANITWYRQVSAGYFDAIGMPVVRGRGFVTGEAAPSVVVNDTFVRRHFPAEDPLGRRIRFGGPDRPWFTIVGVVADARVRGAREPTRVETFLPYWQFPGRGMTVVLAGPNAAQFAPSLRQAMSSLDPNLPLVDLRTMDDVLRETLARPRFLAMLAGGFAAIALVLAAIGIYGVVSFTVAHRTTEIGVRMALGATLGGVFRLVLGDGLRLAIAGTAAGLAGAILMARGMRSLLFGIEPSDPRTLVMTAAVLLAVAAVASLVPAWRASRVDPVVALRAG